MSIASETLDPRDAFPRPTQSRFDRERDTKTIRPYRDPDTGRAPQEEFLAAPDGMGPVESDARFHSFVGGIGSGKTAAGIIRSAVNAEKWNPGELGMIITPTVPALKNVVLPEMRAMGLLDTFEYQGKGSEKPGIITPSGSRIILESADNQRKIDRLRGPSISWFWMDEAAVIPREAWDILTGRLRTGRYRNAFITTTPKGRNWVYDRFYDDPDVNGVFGVHSGMNPHTPDDYVTSISEEYEGSFYEQEVRGEFTQFDGLVYPWFRPDEHVVEDVPRPFDNLVYGVDWGFNNPSVILAIAIRGDDYVVVEEFAESRCTDDDLADVAQRMYDDYGQGPIYCDPSEPGSIETFQREGLDARGADNEVTPGIKHVTGQASNLVVLRQCQNLINEFGQYQYREGDDAGDSPIKANDHSLDALRYALYSRQETQTASTWYNPA